MKYRDIIIGFGDELNSYVIDSFLASIDVSLYLLVPKNLKVASGVLREVKKSDIETLEGNINLSDYRIFMTPEKCNPCSLNPKSVYKYIDRMLDKETIITGYTSDFDPLNGVFDATYEFYILTPKDLEIKGLQEVKKNIDGLETLYVSARQEEYKKYKIPGKYINTDLEKTHDIIWPWIDK